MPRKDAEAGKAALDAFAEGPWGMKYPAIAMSWRRNWAAVIPFYAFPADVRRIIYTTNAIEALNAKLRRAVRTRGHFPSDDSALKLLFLVLNLAEREWRMPPKEWALSAALTSLRGIGPEARWPRRSSRSCSKSASRPLEPRNVQLAARTRNS
jgi:putative transposase